MPTGGLWFPDTAPQGMMFPRAFISIGSGKGDLTTGTLSSIIMIRISQNLLLLSMLKKKYQDVHLVRKTMTTFVLPSWKGGSDTPLELLDCVPRRQKSSGVRNVDDQRVYGLSLMLSRSYIPLVAQIFRSMNRHLSDRAELAILVEGLNRILLVHGNDIGIVSQCLVGMCSAL